jgi:Domain of unknown function (DUF4258)
MPSDASKTPPLSPKDAIQAARRYLNEGQVTWKSHMKERMEERNISLSDVMSIVDTGKINSAPEYDDEHVNYTYRIIGQDVDGKRRSLIVGIDDKEEMLELITVY